MEIDNSINIQQEQQQLNYKKEAMCKGERLKVKG